ncbi:uncharacterized protein LOC116017675 [Ipomoea triloba]|uniref:uncharacterized protein LOC116017675 n=1 Tax=Ipomoea triloba TaxID=35885 RepID=UPI00125D37A2|nr:uncharacterized protein LOC116017675 [Ipomoea triloba]
MRTEMGNTNTSGIQEEEGAAYTKAPQQAEESLNDPPSANDHNVEKVTPVSRNEQDGVDKERVSQFSEVQLEAKDLAIKSSGVQIVDSIEEVGRDEESVEPKYGENSESSDQSFTHSGEVENVDANLDSKSDPLTHINGPVQLLDPESNPPSSNRENFAEMDDSCSDDDMNHCKKTEIEHTSAVVASGVDVEDVDEENNELMMEETASQPDRAIEEEDAAVSSRDKVENGLGNEGDKEGNLELNLDNLEEDVAKMNTLDCSDAASKPNEERMSLPQEIKMASENSFPVNQTEPIEQEVNEFMIESHNQEKEEGYSTKENSISCLGTESIEKQDLVSRPDIDAKEATEIVSGEEISIVHNHEEEKAGDDSIVQKLGDRNDCLTNETEDEEQTLKKDNDSCDDAAKELEFEGAGNSSELPDSDTIKQIFVTNEVRGIPRPEKEQPPGTISEHEIPADLSDEQCANGIISPLPVIRSKTLETTRRYSVDYSSEQPAGNQIETRRFPSFDFGIPFDARSSESDQTPLLRPDKPPTRRLSIDFQNTALQATYARDSLDYDTMGVEEKTIRVERSDPDAGPFLITLKKDENGNLTDKTSNSLLADMKEGNMMFKNIPPPANDQLALASPKGGNGKRKPLPSFFSTCICCTATIN